MIEIDIRLITKGFNSISELKAHKMHPFKFVENWTIYLYYRGMSVRDNELLQIEIPKKLFKRNQEIKLSTIIERYCLPRARYSILTSSDIIPFFKIIMFAVDSSVINTDEPLATNMINIINEHNIGRVDKNQKIIYKKLNDNYFKEGSFACSYSDYTLFEENKKYESIYNENKK